MKRASKKESVNETGPTEAAAEIIPTMSTTDADNNTVDCHEELAKASAILQQLSPLPNSSSVRKRKRKTYSAEIVTSSPYKQRILEKKNNASEKAAKAKQHDRKSNQSEGKQPKKKKKMTCRADKPRGRKPKEVKAKQLNAKSTGRSEKSEDKAKIRRDNNGRHGSDKNETECMMCGEPYRDSLAGEQWIQRLKCNHWCHEDCTGVETSIGFICDFCTA